MTILSVEVASSNEEGWREITFTFTRGLWAWLTNGPFPTKTFISEQSGGTIWYEKDTFCRDPEFEYRCSNEWSRFCYFRKVP